MARYSSREKDVNGNEYIRYYKDQDEYYRVKGCSPTPSSSRGRPTSLTIFDIFGAFVFFGIVTPWGCDRIRDHFESNSVPAEAKIANYIEHHEKTLNVLEKQLADCSSHCGIYKNTVNSQRLKLSNFKKLSLEQQAQDADQSCIDGTFYLTCVDESKSKKKF
jgi:hypothetical protein